MKKASIPPGILDCKFLEKYRIRQNEILGKGGFGVVFAATFINQSKNSQECAIKIQFNENIEAAAQEISIMQKLSNQNPHIIKYIEYFPDPAEKDKYDYSIIVMEKAIKNLFQFLKENDDKLDKPLLMQLFCDIVKGLSYAHSKQVSHSDIKPQNILVFECRANEPDAQKRCVANESLIFKLCDWGIGILGKNIEATQTLGTSIAFSNFAPYEMKIPKNKINSDKADIFSLAIVILNCCGISAIELNSLTSRISSEAFDRDFEEIIKKFINEKKYGSELIDLLRKMCKFDRKDRCRLDDVIESLKRIVDNMSIQEPEIIKRKTPIAKKEKRPCEKCEEFRKEGLISLRCKHTICLPCLTEYFTESFDKNNLFQPKCPIKNCREALPKKSIQKLFKHMNPDLKTFLTECKNSDCQFFTYKCFLRKLPCNHRLCEKCLKEALDNKSCPSCDEHIKKEDRKKLKPKFKNCRICEKQTKDLTFTCCGLEVCIDCFSEYFLEDYKKMSEKKKNAKVLCKYCWKNLLASNIKDLIDKESYDFLKKFMKREKQSCSNCRELDFFDMEILPECKHRLCKNCLLDSIDNKHCPLESCVEKIPKDIIKKHRPDFITINTPNEKKNRKETEFGFGEEEKKKSYEIMGKERTQSCADVMMKLAKSFQKTNDEKIEVKENISKNQMISQINNDLPDKNVENQVKILENFENLENLKKIPEILANKNKIEELKEDKKEDEKNLCFSCKKQTPENEIFKTDCGHINCRTCIINQFNWMISAKKVLKVDDFKCPKCEKLFDDKIIKELKNENITHKYNYCLNEKLIDEMKEKWAEEDKAQQTPGGEKDPNENVVEGN